MSKIFRRFVFLLLIFSTGCSGNDINKNYQNISQGDYNFIMYDSNNVIIAEGLLAINDLTGSEISGSYNFTKVITKFDGYGTMNKGRFTGKINQKEKNMLVNTNPGQADKNVLFNFDFGKNPVVGTWYYTGFRNNSKPGNIKLTKK